MPESLVNAWRELRRRPIRSLWAVAGHAAAAATLVVGVALLTATREESARTLRLTGAQFIGFVVDATAAVADWPDPVREGFQIHGHPARLFPLDRVQALNAAPSVLHATPMLGFRIAEARDQMAAANWMVAGFHPADMAAAKSAACSATEVIAGRAFAPGDRGVALVEQSFAVATGRGLDATLTLAGQAFRVVGVLSPGTRPVKADIYLPWDDAVAVVNARRTVPLRDEANLVLVDGISTEGYTETLAVARRILGPGATEIGYSCWRPARNAVRTGRIGLGWSAMLVVVLFVAWTTQAQSAAVRERRRDIAVLRAIGWTDAAVRKQIVAECLLQALCGGAGGIAAAGLLLRSPAFARFAAPAASLSPAVWMLAAGWLAALLLGVLSALAPVRQALGLRPSEILRQP